MTLDEHFKRYMEQHGSNIKLAIVHGNMDEALRIVFTNGYEAAMIDVQDQSDVIYGEWDNDDSD